MRYSFKSLLLGSVAATACTIALIAPSSAAAQCTASGSTVTSSGTTTDTQAQQAINSATPPTLTLTIGQGAVIESASRTIAVGSFGAPVFVPPSQFVLPPSFSTVTFDNVGRIGTSPSLTTDLYFPGGNTFSGSNSGVIDGSLVIGGAPYSFMGSSSALGGTGTLSNTGIVTGTVSLTGRGDQTYTGAGTIQGGQFPFPYQSGLTVASMVSTTTFDANNRQTTTVAGGTGNATVDGALRSTGTTPLFRGVSVSGHTGANATVNGTTGGVTVFALSANTSFQNASTFTAGGFSFSYNSTSQAVGGAASVTVGANGTINGTASVTGLTGATASVNGAIAAPVNEYGDRGLRVTAGGTDTSFAQSQTQTFGAASSASSFQSASTSTSRGGSASVTIGAGGSVAGGVVVVGGATANADVNGAIGGASFPNGLTVTAGATDTMSNSTGRSDGSGGSSNSSGSSTQRGGAARARRSARAARWRAASR